MKMFDHEYTTFIVCPHCGYQHVDTCDFTEDEDDVDCHECEKTFTYERIVEVSYITKPKKEQP